MANSLPDATGYSGEDEWCFQVLHLPGHEGFIYGVNLRRGEKAFAARMKHLTPDAITNVICSLKDVTVDEGEYWPTESRESLRSALECELAGTSFRC